MRSGRISSSSVKYSGQTVYELLQWLHWKAQWPQALQELILLAEEWPGHGVAHRSCDNWQQLWHHLQWMTKMWKHCSKFSLVLCVCYYYNKCNQRAGDALPWVWRAHVKTARGVTSLKWCRHGIGHLVWRVNQSGPLLLMLTYPPSVLALGDASVSRDAREPPKW